MGLENRPLRNFRPENEPLRKFEKMDPSEILEKWTPQKQKILKPLPWGLKIYPSEIFQSKFYTPQKFLARFGTPQKFFDRF